MNPEDYILHVSNFHLFDSSLPLISLPCTRFCLLIQAYLPQINFPNVQVPLYNIINFSLPPDKFGDILAHNILFWVWPYVCFSAEKAG